MLRHCIIVYVFALHVARAQQTVNINPQQDIPGIGVVFGGDNEKPVLDRWQFWLGIGIAAAIFIVICYFVWRGFRNYKKWKKERQIEKEKQEAETKLKLDKDLHACACVIDVEDLARRTGRRKEELMNSLPGSKTAQKQSAETPQILSLAQQATSPPPPPP